MPPSGQQIKSMNVALNNHRKNTCLHKTYFLSEYVMGSTVGALYCITDQACTFSMSGFFFTLLLLLFQSLSSTHDSTSCMLDYLSRVSTVQLSATGNLDLETFFFGFPPWIVPGTCYVMLCYVMLSCGFVLCCSSLFHEALLWRSAKNPTYIVGVLSAVAPTPTLGTCQKLFPSLTGVYSSLNKMIIMLFETRYGLAAHKILCWNYITSSSQSHDFPCSCKPLKSYDVENKVCNHGTVYPWHNCTSPDLSDPQSILTAFGIFCLSETGSPYSKGIIIGIQVKEDVKKTHCMQWLLQL